MIHLLAKLHDMDGRWLYGVMLLVLILPFALTIPMPSHITSSATFGLHDAIEACPKDKVVWIDSTWDMGSRAECRAQIDCIVRHLCRRGIRFVVTSVAASPFAPEFARNAIEPIADEAGYVYGRDWVNAGFVQAGGNMGVVIDGLCRDFQKIYPADDQNTPMAELPLMARMRSIEDVHLVCCITYAPSPDWISFVKGQHGTPVGFACMSIMAPNYFTFLDSRQLCGMLVGNRGAAEYEALEAHPAKGTRLIMAASFGVCVIIGAALLGNIGMWARRRIERGSA
ncbi:hypothetical protein HQ560_13290 [bacterium]|nr:hypothetical protein [bacterium]